MAHRPERAGVLQALQRALWLSTARLVTEEGRYEADRAVVEQLLALGDDRDALAVAATWRNDVSGRDRLCHCGAHDLCTT